MKNIYIFDCSNGKLRVARANSVIVGNVEDATINVKMEPGIAGIIKTRGDRCTFFPKTPYEFRGQISQSSIELEENSTYLLSSNSGLFVVLYTSLSQQEIQNEFTAYNNNAWYWYNNDQNCWNGPYSIPQLMGLSATLPPSVWVTMSGMNNDMCTLSAFCKMGQLQYPTVSAIQNPLPATPRPGVPNAMEEATNDIPETGDIDEHNGDYLCPSCWLRFDAGDIMSIASHPDLMGDPVLGRDVMQRFYATRFNSRGQALDARGMPCMHMACPHCRHQLPPRFMESDIKIFSIIGAPSSGKSYYLASLIHEMAYKCASEFQLAWRDADPAGNSQLNDVSNRLFSAATPEQAYLSKTDLEGALYEEFYRHGRMVKLPKPFVYNISKLGSKKPPLSLVFYDNAGEHFEPGRNNEDSPGAMHVAVASGLFFLFDPTTSPAFRKIISGTDDPQIKGNTGQMDQQSVIMAETESRIASILNNSSDETLHTPFAVIIGKSDLWESYLETPEGGGRPLLPATADGKILTANIDANSARLRELMLKLQPGICTTAEIISDNVRYFAVSQLGSSPVTFEDPAYKVTRIGPDPAKIAPRHMCIPTLWVLSQIAPDYIPSTR